MPCYDGRDREQELASALGAHRAQLEKLEAAFCAVLTKMERDNLFATVLSDIDWKEAGVSRKFFDTWWKQHKAYDEQRRKRAAELLLQNAEKEARKKQKEAILAKLSPEERKILGL